MELFFQVILTKQKYSNLLEFLSFLKGHFFQILNWGPLPIDPSPPALTGPVFILTLLLLL